MLNMILFILCNKSPHYTPCYSSLEVFPHFSLRWPAPLVRQGWGGRRAGGCPPTRVFSAHHTQKLRVLHVTVTVLRANVYHLPQKNLSTFIYLSTFITCHRKNLSTFIYQRLSPATEKIYQRLSPATEKIYQRLFINVYHLPQKKSINVYLSTFITCHRKNLSTFIYLSTFITCHRKNLSTFI